MAKKKPQLAPPLHLAGALDLHHLAECWAQLSAAAADPALPVIVDLSAVTACDTAGLQLLYSASRSVRDWQPRNPSEAILRACAEVGIQPEQLLL